MKNKKTFSNKIILAFADFFLHRKKIFYAIVLCIIFILGGAFRFHSLSTIPSGLHGEEANSGLLALQLNSDNVINSFIQNGFDSGIFPSLIQTSFKIFGINVFGLKFIAAFIGFLTIFGFFLLLRELRFSRLLVFLGTFLISFSFWHINFSRLAYFEVFIPFFIVWFSFLLMRGLFSQKHLYFILSGTFIGIGIWTHPLMVFSTLIPIILISYVSLVDRKFFKKFKLHLILFVFSILLFSAPLLIQVVQNPSIFQDAFKETLNFDKSDSSIVKNAISYFGLLFYLGDSNQLHNYKSLPIIPLAWSILFLFGFFLSARSIILSLYGYFKKTTTPKNMHSSILAQSIFLVAILIGSLNASEEPSSRQFIWAIPAVFIFCIIPFEYLMQIYQKLKLSTRISMKKWRWRVLQFSIICLVLTIVMAGISQTYLYFDVWANSKTTKQVFSQNQVDFGIVIKNLKRGEQNLIVIPENVEILENGKTKTLKTIEFSGFPDIKNYKFIHPAEGLIHAKCENSLIVFYKTEDLLRKQFQKKCPENNFKKIISSDGTETFWTIRR